jgi:hypothetical protein
MPNICSNYLKCVFPAKTVYEQFLRCLEQNNWFSTFGNFSISDTRGYTRFEDHILDYDLLALLWTTKLEPYNLTIIYQDDQEYIIELKFSTTRIPPLSVYKTMWENNGIEIDAKFDRGSNGCHRNQ